MKARPIHVLAPLYLLSAMASAEPAQSASAAAQQDPVGVNDPAFMATFTQQYREAFKDGAIPAKYKQLSAATLSSSNARIASSPMSRWRSSSARKARRLSRHFALV